MLSTSCCLASSLDCKGKGGVWHILLTNTDKGSVRQMLMISVTKGGFGGYAKKGGEEEEEEEDL